MRLPQKEKKEASLRALQPERCLALITWRSLEINVLFIFTKHLSSAGHEVRGITIKFYIAMPRHSGIIANKFHISIIYRRGQFLRSLQAGRQEGCD